MPIAVCTWCSRSRLVETHTWKSPRSGEQLAGLVCGHCYFGSGGDDDCRTCRARRARAERLEQPAVHALGREDVLAMLMRKYGKRGARHD